MLVRSAAWSRTWRLAWALLLAWGVPGEAQEDLPDIEAMGGLGFLGEDYSHVAYHFSSFRQGAGRWGEGELWLALGGPAPRVRLKGYAYSPRFGHGEITLVLDAGKRVMYALLKLGELREAQCMSFPFPRTEDDPERLERLRWREKQVAKHWSLQSGPDDGHGDPHDPMEVLAVNWTKSYTLDLLIGHGPGRVRGIDVRQGSRIVKTVRIKNVKTEADKQDKGQDYRGEDVFTMPYNNCTPVNKVDDPLLLVEIKPPHKKSSALGDLLLVLADRAAGGHWPRGFLALCAVVVPGDVAVMIEEPPPPDLAKLDGLAFEYTAKVYRLGGNVSFDDPAKDLQDREGSSHLSSGSVTLDLVGRGLRLHGEEEATKVGPVVTDLLAHGLGPEPRVWANVKLPAQGEQRCGVYGFPPGIGFGAGGGSALEQSSRSGLSFVGIDAIKGEDTGIFAADLPRSRRIFIWVDMESDRPGEFLRAEVQKRGRRLRRVDVIRWNPQRAHQVQPSPKKEWNCTGEFGVDPFVHLGLRDLQSWSSELQDALRSLRELPRAFAVLEMLALAGDVCLMVKEPEAPELWRLPGLSFGYTLFLGGTSAHPGEEFWVGEGPYTLGSVAVDHLRSRFQITASASGEDEAGAANISLAFSQGTLAVRIQRPGDERCLSIAPEHRQVSFRPPPAGVFDGVEQIGDAECDRFTYPGTVLHQNSSVRFWLSREDPEAQANAAAGNPGPVGGRVCQLEVRGDRSIPSRSRNALLYVSAWEESYHPMETADWGCLPVEEVVRPWIDLAPEPMPVEKRFTSALWPTSTALGRLMEAFSILGVFPQKWMDDAMQRLIIRLPPKLVTTTTPAPLGLMSPELTTISFSFTSTYMQNVEQLKHNPHMSQIGSSHKGRGELRADLAGRHLYLRSRAENISRGIPQLESEVYWSAEQGRLFARTRLEEEGYEQCWSVEAPAPEEMPEGSSRNPFLHFISKGLGKEVRDTSTRSGMDRYIMYLDPWTIAELFTDASSALSAIHFKDFKDPRRASSVGVVVHEWSTEPMARGPLEPGSGWACEDIAKVEGGHSVLAWDIIRLLFPSV